MATFARLLDRICCIGTILAIKGVVIVAGVLPLRTTNQWAIEIGLRLRQTRLSRNFTQEHLAVQANISVGALKQLEAGRGSKLQTLIQVVRALGSEQWLELLPVPQSTFSPIALLRQQQAEESRQRKRAPRRIGDQ
jgi:transcriptional regulator with XRE-family HTH domain